MSLSDRLQNAAILRAEGEPNALEGCVISPDGVIDLRAAEEARMAESRIPAELPEVGTVDLNDLYANDEVERGGWWRRS